MIPAIVEFMTWWFGDPVTTKWSLIQKEWKLTDDEINKLCYHSVIHNE